MPRSRLPKCLHLGGDGGTGAARGIKQVDVGKALAVRVTGVGEELSRGREDRAASPCGRRVAGAAGRDERIGDRPRRSG